jgi:hypothetical protein
MLDQLAAYIIHSPALRVFVAVVVAANLLTVSYVNMVIPHVTVAGILVLVDHIIVVDEV